MKLSRLGICGIISLLSYAAFVFISPFAYPGYNAMSMAVSELSAVGAPSRALAGQLNSLFGPCGIVNIMAVCVAVSGYESKLFKTGIYFFAAMEWICNVGYGMFPWISDTSGFHFQNMMHIVVTVAVVVLSIASLILIAIGALREKEKSIGVWAILCLVAMLGGALATNVLSKAVFGIAERFSTFSVVVFNAILGYYLFRGRFDRKEDVSENSL